LAIAAASGFRSVGATPLFSRSGEPLGTISAHFRRPQRPTQRELRYADQAADMIERRRAQDTLLASEERSRRYFEMGLVGMVTTSVSKGILEVNDELCRILGYEREELLRRTWAEMTYPDDLGADLTQFERVLAGETDGYWLDKRWIRRDGCVIHSIMSMQCVRRPDGSIDHLLGQVLDTTARRQTEEALRRAREELAHLTRVTSMGELTAAIAHELNQPMAAIAANAAACLRWLSRKTPELQEAQQALERILRDSERAGAVLQWVRNFSRKNEPQKKPLDVNHAIREVVLLARPNAARHGVALHTELAESLPLVFGDRVQLQQVVLNLVMNGIEAMSERSLERPELVIRTRVEDAERVLVMVRDYGVGLQHGVSEQVFEPFYTTKSKGMGLGLTISRRIVEAHQGQLWASLNEGAGATFQFSVPVLSPEQA
jgi:PAS domain S-box-containing protein